MNLADMLSYADIYELSRIADTYECECSGNSKNELIQSILSAVNRREVFERLIRGLDLEDIRFLNSLLFDQRNSFSLEELIARAQLSKFQKEGEESRNPREMISKFKHLGWLFKGYSQHTKYLFQVPLDLKRRFSDVLTRKFQENLRTTDNPSVYRDEQMLIVDDIRHFLHSVHQHSGIQLTSENYMYKRVLQQILDCMSVREVQVSKGGWRFGYGRMFKEYPNRFSLIYDYCYFEELISEQNLILTLTDKGKSKLMDGVKENIAQVYRLWLRLYKGPIPNIQSIVQWVDRLAGQWITVSSLGSVLRELIRPFYYDTSDSIFEQRILQMMMHLGLLRIGEDEALGQVVQMTKLGSSIVQGTYVAEEDKIELKLDQLH